MIQPAAPTLSRGRWLVAWAAALLAAIGSITVWLSAAARDQPGAFDFDVVILNGDVYDGTGRPARRVDVGLRGDRIARLGNLQGARSRHIDRRDRPRRRARLHQHALVVDRVPSDRRPRPERRFARA